MIHILDGQIVPEDTEGATPCYVTMEPGRLWAMCRCKDRTTFEEQALLVGLLEDTEDGRWPVRDVTITHIGPLYSITGEGEDAVSVVVDSRHHVNFWLGPEALAKNQWQAWAQMWSRSGTEVDANVAEVAVSWRGIELVDPDTVRTPLNRML